MLLLNVHDVDRYLKDWLFHICSEVLQGKSDWRLPHEHYMVWGLGGLPPHGGECPGCECPEGGGVNFLEPVGLN